MCVRACMRVRMYVRAFDWWANSLPDTRPQPAQDQHTTGHGTPPEKERNTSNTGKTRIYMYDCCH